MNNGWNKFVDTEPGRHLKKFFLKLNQEIAENASDQKLRGAVLLLNTRKGYWIYKIFEKRESVDAVKVYSDRYVQKILDFSVFAGKIIYLVDDTLIHGYSLLETYELLAKNLDEKLICPIVFAMSDEIDIEKEKQSAEGVRKNFWNKLKFYLRMSKNELGQLCITETQLIHAEGVPNMIDLPFIKDAGRVTGMLDFQVTLTENQFKALQSDRSGWKFHFNSNNVRGQMALQGFIMQMDKEPLLEATKEFAYDFVMEGVYTSAQDGHYKVVFTPFAILKSMSKVYLLKLWNALFDEHDKYCTGGKEDEGTNRWIKYHRECVYALSMMITDSFCREVAAEIGIKLCYDYEILKDHFPADIIERMRGLEKLIQADHNLLGRRLAQISGEKNEFLYDSPGREYGTKTESRKEYNERSARSQVQKVILEKRGAFIDRNTADTPEQKLAVMLEIGQMEKLLDDKFEYKTKQEKRYALTQDVVTILRSSICSNKLEVSQDGRFLIRGFRYGENSDLLLPFFDLSFYWAVILLVSKYKKDGAARRYDDFVMKLRSKYEDLKLLKEGDDASKENFQLNRDYYKSVLDRRQSLYNKFCFVQPYLHDQLNESETYYMKKMEEFIEGYC